MENTDIIPSTQKKSITQFFKDMYEEKANVQLSSFDDDQSAFPTGGVIIKGVFTGKAMEKGKVRENDWSSKFSIIVIDTNQKQLKKFIKDGQLYLPTEWVKDIKHRHEDKELPLPRWVPGMTLTFWGPKKLVDQLSNGDFVNCEACTMKLTVESTKDPEGKKKPEEKIGGDEIRFLSCSPTCAKFPGHAFIARSFFESGMQNWIIPPLPEPEDETADRQSEEEKNEENLEEKTDEWKGNKGSKRKYGPAIFIAVTTDDRDPLDSIDFKKYDYLSVLQKMIVNPPKSSGISEWVAKNKSQNLYQKLQFKFTLSQCPIGTPEDITKYANQSQMISISAMAWPESYSTLAINDPLIWQALGPLIFGTGEFEYILGMRIEELKSWTYSLSSGSDYRSADVFSFIADVPSYYRKIGIPVTRKSVQLIEKELSPSIPKKTDVIALNEKTPYNTSKLTTMSNVSYVCLVAYPPSVYPQIKGLISKMTPETGDKIVDILKKWSPTLWRKYSDLKAEFKTDEEVFVSKISPHLPKDTKPIMANFALFHKEFKDVKNKEAPQWFGSFGSFGGPKVMLLENGQEHDLPVVSKDPIVEEITEEPESKFCDENAEPLSPVKKTKSEQED